MSLSELTVGDLRKALEGVPDHTPVLILVPDNVYACPLTGAGVVPSDLASGVLLLEQDNETVYEVDLSDAEQDEDLEGEDAASDGG